MKLPKLFLAALLIGFSAIQAQAQHTVQKLWETDTLLNIPESALPHKDILYVSLIDGPAWTADGKGGVAQMSKTGKIINTNWITGLNAPKGLAIVGDMLYVADLDQVVAISISKNKIDHTIKLPGATGLNDATADKNGVVYVTDSRQGLVFKVQDKTASVYMDNLPGINGIKAIGDKLYILSGKALNVADADKKLTKLCALPNNGDGLEPVGNGDFLVTLWDGYLYYVNTAKGTADLLLDTHTTNKKTADIGYDPATRIIYIPSFLGKSLSAYQLK
jgi:hypothetical protein